MGQPRPPSAPVQRAEPPPPAGPWAALLVELGGPLLLQLAAAHRLRQQTLAALAAAAVRRLWQRVDRSDPVGSWARISGAAVGEVAGAQASAAAGVDDYVAVALRAQGAAADPVGAVRPNAFAGTAADGRPLGTLLGYPAFETSAFIDRGMPAGQAAGIGGRHLERIVANEVADAARIATGVAIVNDRHAAGWMRMLTPPSCSRCIILAGKTYATADGAGFQRHPLCDCIAVPAAELVDPPSPRDVFDAMSDEQLRRAGWTKADIAAIRDHNADISQVTNAHRELYKVEVAGQQVKASRVGTSRRGLAGQRLGRRAMRLTPASISSEAARLGWGRYELVAALRRHGYIL